MSPQDKCHPNPKEFESAPHSRRATAWDEGSQIRSGKNRAVGFPQPLLWRKHASNLHFGGIFHAPWEFWGQFPLQIQLLRRRRTGKQPPPPEPGTQDNFFRKTVQTASPSTTMGQNAVFCCPTLENTRKNPGFRSQLQGKPHKNAGFTIITPENPAKMQVGTTKCLC